MALVLHDAGLRQLVNDWLCGLGETHFIHILPLVRRTFSAFSASERSDLGQRARQGCARLKPPSARPAGMKTWPHCPFRCSTPFSELPHERHSSC